MSSDPAAYTFPPRANSAHWASASEGAYKHIEVEWHGKHATRTHNNDWDTHKFQESSAFFVVLASDSDCSPGEFVHIFHGTFAMQ